MPGPTGHQGICPTSPSSHCLHADKTSAYVGRTPPTISQHGQAGQVVVTTRRREAALARQDRRLSSSGCSARRNRLPGHKTARTRRRTLRHRRPARVGVRSGTSAAGVGPSRGVHRRQAPAHGARLPTETGRPTPKTVELALHEGFRHVQGQGDHTNEKQRHGGRDGQAPEPTVRPLMPSDQCSPCRGRRARGWVRSTGSLDERPDFSVSSIPAAPAARPGESAGHRLDRVWGDQASCGT